MNLYYPPPDEQLEQIENHQEIVNTLFNKLFGDSELAHIWIARNVYSAPIRKLAITFHMSRYNIRKRLEECDNKIDQIRNVFSL
jgi:hypothetical protein